MNFLKNVMRTGKSKGDVGENILNENDPVFREALVSKLRDWSLRTTTHGIPRLMSSDKRHTRLLWLVFFFISSLVCCLMIYKYISEYLKYEVTSNIRNIPQHEMVFPVVSVCNLNMFTTPEGQRYMKLSNASDLKAFFGNHNDRDQLNTDVNISPLVYLGWKKYLTYHPNFNQTLKRSFSFGREMIRLCEYNYAICRNFNLDEFYHPIYGTCVRFNYYHNGVPLASVGREGDGLYLELFNGVPGELNPSNTHVSRTNGIAVLINDQNAYPMHRNSILIKPGNYARVKLNKFVSNMLPVPYSNCTRGNSLRKLFGPGDMVNLSSISRYDRRACLNVCQQKLIVDGLDCQDLTLPLVYVNKPYCASLKDFERIHEFMLDLDICFNLCPYECDSVRFDTTVSYGEFPSFTYYQKMLEKSGQFYRRQFKTDNITYEQLMKSVSGVYVYYDEIKYVHISESESIQLTYLVANIGAALGLFIGVSLLSLVELVELAIDLAIIVCKFFNFKALLPRRKKIHCYPFDRDV